MSASPGQAIAPAGSIGLSGAFFAAAALYLAAGAVGLVWIAPDLAASAFLVPRVAGVTHLFTLGWITMTIFGAIYQLLPVALGAPIRWEWIARASWCGFAPGVGMLAAGVAFQSSALQHAGVGFVAAGIALVLANVVPSLSRAANRDATWLGFVLAFTCLVATFGMGAVLLHNLQTGFAATARVRILMAHFHVALVGWALMMIVGVSHRLLPMFLLAHRAEVRWTKRALLLLFAGVATLATGLIGSSAAVEWIGIAALASGLGCFLTQARAFHRVRVRKRLDVGMQFVAAALGFFVVAGLLGITLAGLQSAEASRTVGVAYVIAGLVGGVTIYVVGLSYKIIPLLVWTAAYRSRIGKAPVPLVADMYSTRAATTQLALMTAAIVTLILSVLAASPAGAYAGAVLFLVGTLVFVAQLVRVTLHLRIVNTS